MDQAEPHLKVTDRRHFTADGELKTAANPASHEGEGPPQTPSAHDAADAPPIGFSAFIISLATQAADFLASEQKNLGAARQVISVLEMLKDKTEGRRTDEESRLLEAVLFDLRLAFVGAAKGSAS